MRRRFVPARTLAAVVLGLLGIVVAASTTMRADDWPTRPVRLLIPFTAGGTADMLGRLAAESSHSLLVNSSCRRISRAPAG
jgi:tripartite-type tricarboxylate transporter receptor subunit TctC